MKKSKLLLSLLAVLFFGHVASSQVKVGILACPQFNQSFGVRVGTDVSIPFSSRWSLEPGLYWSLRNRDNYESHTIGGDETRYDYHDNAHFLTIPLRVGVRLAGNPDGDFMFKLLFGPYIAYGLGGTSECLITENGVERQVETGAFDANGRYSTRLDYGLNTGVKFVVKKHILLGAYVEGGWRKIYRANSVFEDIVGEIFVLNKINVALGLSLGYQF